MHRFTPTLADEVPLHKVKHLIISALFVDVNRDGREEYLTFLKLDKITGREITETISNFLQDNHMCANF